MDTKTLCLAVLARGPASGYEIKKTLGQPPHSLFQDTGFGSIYPALNRLAEEGAVVAVQFEQHKRPDKKVFSLTEAGCSRLREALAQPPAPDRMRSDFLFVLLNGDLLPPEHLLAVVDLRIGELEQQLSEMERCVPPQEVPCRGFLHGLGIAYYRACLNYLREHRPALEKALREANQRPAGPTAE